MIDVNIFISKKYAPPNKNNIFPRKTTIFQTFIFRFQPRVCTVERIQFDNEKGQLQPY